MTQTTAFVCSSCRFSPHEASRNGISGGQHLIEQLHQTLNDRDLQDIVRLEPVRCMAGCQQYTAGLDGRVPYGDRPVAVQRATAFVLPPLPIQFVHCSLEHRLACHST